MAKIEPKILKGFRDFSPEEQIPRRKMIETIKASYENFGFEPIETPALEYAEILTGKYGDEGDKLMYRFKDNGDRDVALRYDLTIPLARFTAMNGNLKKPFKAYQISPVWRADNTQKGRYREFYQCDADIIGSNSPLSDSEVLALAGETLKKLGVDDFVIKVNSRLVLSAFYDSLKLSSPEKISVMRAVDKMDKIGREGVGDLLREYGFNEKNIEAIMAFASMSRDFIAEGEDLLEIIKEIPSIKEPLSDLLKIIQNASMLSPGTKFVLDFSIARGLDYYTGMIFETSLTKAKSYGSVLSGGRYDGLIGIFSNKPVPAVGASIGLDRLFSALTELGLVKSEKTTALVMVANLEQSFLADYLRMISDLRKNGINSLFYFEPGDMKKQLSYASEKGMRYVVIYGENEALKSEVIIKDLETGKQKSVPVTDIVKSLKNA